MFPCKQTKFQQLFARKCLKLRKKSKKRNLTPNLQLMTIVFNSNYFKTIIYTKQCSMPSFVANKKSFNHFLRESTLALKKKRLKKPQKHNLARNLKHITIVYNSNHFNTITYTKQCCVPRFLANKPSFKQFLRESAQTAEKKSKKRNLASNFKRMTIFFNSIYFKTIIYKKQCCVPSFVANKPCLNHFMLESAKNVLKKFQKHNLARNFKHMTIVFDSNHFNTIQYSKQCSVPSFVANKPSFYYFLQECAENAFKNLTNATQHVISKT